MIAVLTGDIVSSTKMSPTTYSQMLVFLQSLLNNAEESCQAQGEIYRGDGFQLHYPNPGCAIKNTLLIKLALHLSALSDKPILSTLSLAFGEHDRLTKKPNLSSGPVFIASGRGLDKTQRGDLTIHFPAPNDNREMDLLTKFLNHQLNRLTKSQAQLLYLYVENDFAEHKKIAQITGTSRQNISNRLANIGAFLVRDFVDKINDKVEKLKEGS